MASHPEWIEIKRLDHEIAPFWSEFYDQYEGKKLIDLPFFYSEVYFYALINAVVDYNHLRIDPFGLTKTADIIANRHFFKKYHQLSKLQDWQLEDYISFALLGNKSDLSQLYAKSDQLTLLIDDSASLSEFIINSHQIHMILDNAGLELYGDLMLAHHIAKNHAKTVILHLKNEPLLVSDAMPIDVEHLLCYLDSIELGTFSNELKDQIKDGKIIIKSNAFLECAPTFYRLFRTNFITVCTDRPDYFQRRCQLSSLF